MSEIEGVMEKIKRFLSSLYLGDRYCENVEILNKNITFQFNCISRIKPGTSEWNFYNDENVEHGCLVFDEVKEYQCSSDLPFNEDIYDIKVKTKEKDIYTFVVLGSNVSDDSVTTEIEMVIQAKKVYVYNPKNNLIIYQ